MNFGIVYVSHYLSHSFQNGKLRDVLAKYGESQTQITKEV